MKKRMFAVLFVFVVLSVLSCAKAQVVTTTRTSTQQPAQQTPSSDYSVFTFPVVVDYSRSIEEMKTECNCFYNDAGINSENFNYFRQEKKVEENLHVFCPNREITTGEVNSLMEEWVFRPATLPELLAFGAKYPWFQEESGSVVAFGSVDVQNRVPCLSKLYPTGGINLPAGRFLGLYPNDGWWQPAHCFLAADK